MSWRDPADVAAVEEAARSIYGAQLRPIAERFEFEAPPLASETSGLPMVLLLGNHSAGKSSFINFLVHEEIQRTGIAPVDDSFTIITHGAAAADKDGNAVITNPQLAWGDLERFGPQLVSHLRLKVRPRPELEGLALVDTPGMIDAASSKTDRGYDFAAVVRWFAERADVILFLFDPDKPGTTGETLRILTDSLAGLDHKLLLIFNKVDRFQTMRDFARAYGALCWNLSKAIPRKDLPHVYNTYLPGDGEDASREPGQPGAGGLPLDDFAASREEVRGEVRRAPYRRLDNVISRLYQYARRLRVHARVLDQLSRERFRHKLVYGAVAALLLSLCAGLSWAEWRLIEEASARWSWFGGTLLATLLALAATVAVYTWDQRLRRQNLSLDALFERTYSRELTLGDNVDDLRALWTSVRDRVRRALDARGEFPRLRRGDLRKLSKVLEEEVPRLRTQVSEEKRRAEAVEPAATEAEAAGAAPAEAATEAEPAED